MERLSNLAGPVLLADFVPPPPVLVEPVRRQRRLKPSEIDELVAMYASGLSVSELAAQVKIHRTTVMAHLRRRGIQTRGNVRRLDDDQAKRAAALYETGLSLAVVGARFGVNAEVIRQELIQLGVERRRPGRQQEVTPGQAPYRGRAPVGRSS